MQPEVPSSLREHYFSLEHHASECIGCKGCEKPLSVWRQGFGAYEKNN
jgi:hypothetical protein